MTSCHIRTNWLFSTVNNIHGNPQVEVSTLIFLFINGDFSTLIFQRPPSQLLYLGDKVSELQINEGRWMGFRFMDFSSYTIDQETNLTATPKAFSSSIHGIVEKWYRRFIFIQREGHPLVFAASFGHAGQIIEGTLVHIWMMPVCGLTMVLVSTCLVMLSGANTKPDLQKVNPYTGYINPA